ncbi:MAG: leucyl/phenylalanyl-tRNA--protein transferase [Rectinema sp.]|nr:leucyl/phenylalanyl-tRNA--protein transferase [Rectinema sp.]
MRWCSPDPRFVVPSGFLHITESARRLLRKALAEDSDYRLTLDTAFPEVIAACANIPRPGQDGTWIFPELIEAYTDLYRRGYAHSVELWKKGALVGGLYGVSLGAAFFGESMFSRESNASKIAFLILAITLFNGGFEFIDCQVYTRYLELMGGILIPRYQYLALLRRALQTPDRKGPWSLLFPEFPDTNTILSRLHTWRSPMMDNR